MRGQPSHAALVEAAARRRARMLPCGVITKIAAADEIPGVKSHKGPLTAAPKPIGHARWPEAQLEALEDMAKMYGHVQVDFRLRSFDERPAIHVEWRTNCTKCGATQAGHYLHRFSCEEPVFETKLVYHYQPDEERTAFLMPRFDILETLKDWNAEWAER